MRTKIYYAGDKPSIQEIATVIAQEFKLPAEQLQPAYMPEGLAVAFIGTEDHGGKPHKVALEFANTLDTKRMEAAALYCTSPKKSGECLKELRKVLEGRGIKVLPEELICNGKGGLFAGGKNPTQEDVAAAKAFAQSCMNKALNHEL
jgi:hypothetical protein